MRKRLTISLVIPAYNEESHLDACLRSALTQQMPFDEIIVVDNNSTDSTVAVAAQFPAVTVLREARQGVVHARHTGFDAARGTIIARIDADTRLPSDWTLQLARIFADQTVAAVSGSLHYHDVAANYLIDAMDLRIRKWLACKMAGRTFLLGANMAVRRSAWRRVRMAVCHGPGVHEDLDLAVHLAERQAAVIFDAGLHAGVSGQRVDTNILDFGRYLRSMPKSYASHGAPESRYMYPVILFVLAHYVPLRILFRGYDARQDRFSWLRLLNATTAVRVNPTTFVE